MKIIELKQLRSDKSKEVLAVLEVANNENREMNEEEFAQYEKLKKEEEALEKRVLQAEETETRKREQISNKSEIRHNKEKETEEKKVVKRYSFLKAVRSQLPNENYKLDGAELEMHQEATREAKESNINITGIGVPAFFMHGTNEMQEKRDLEIAVTTAGGHLKQTSVGELIPFLQPRLQTQSLGATMLTGLVGDLDLPRNDAIGTGTWEGEDDANAETTPTFDKISLSPNRVGAYTEVTKQLMFQAENVSVENFVRNDLSRAIAIALDTAAINGSGTGGQPTGILNVSGIGDVAGGTNGANPDWADIVDLESDVATANADMGALSYLTTPGVRGYLKKTLLDSGSGLFIWPNDQRPNGYRAEVSTIVPSTLDKGTSTGVCHAIIFGNWNDLIIANWGGIDLVVDPYSLVKNAKIQLVINSWWDIAVRHPLSFSAMQDALI